MHKTCKTTCIEYINAVCNYACTRVWFFFCMYTVHNLWNYYFTRKFKFQSLNEQYMIKSCKDWYMYVMMKMKNLVIGNKILNCWTIPFMVLLNKIHFGQICVWACWSFGLSISILAMFFTQIFATTFEMYTFFNDMYTGVKGFKTRLYLLI